MIKPKFTQENFIKLLNEFAALHNFVHSYYNLPWWRRLLFGRSIMTKYLKKSIFGSEKPKK